MKSYENYVYAGNEKKNEEYIYSQKNIEFHCGNVELNNILVSNENISVNCSQLSSGLNTIVYSKNGNVNINAGNMEFHGMIYAPNGTVTINGSNVTINGIISANKVITNTSTFISNGSEVINSLYCLFQGIRNDTVLDTNMEVDGEEDFAVEYESNKEIKTIDVYVRYDNEEAFTYYEELNLDSNKIQIERNYQYLDVAFIGKTILGEEVKSDVHSFNVYEGDVESYSSDEDQDKIFDSDERWITNTNPNKEDTDDDGFTDYEECFILGTSPIEYTQDTDADMDGLKNSEEIDNKTNPQMEDSDFDGITDVADGEPNVFSSKNTSISEIQEIWVSDYDRVTTTLMEDLKISKFVYDPINRVVKLSGDGNTVTRYFYDMEGNQIADIVEYNNEYRVNIYSYDKEGNIVKLVNNGDLYDIEYDEDGEMKTVHINDTLYLDYDKKEDILTYGNEDVITLEEEEKNTYNKYCNGERVAEYTLDENGAMIEYVDSESGIVYDYEYDENNMIQTVQSDAGFSTTYEYSDEKIDVTYTEGEEEKSQEIYTENHNTTKLISDAVMDKCRIEEEICCSVSKADESIQDTTYIYDDENEQVKEITYQDGTTYRYEYNFVGQISKIYRNDELQVKYDYKDNGQLHKEQNMLTGEVREYYYDYYNNIEKVVEYNSLQPDKKQELLYEYQSELWNDVLTSYDGNTITYDGIGNPVKYYDNSIMKWQGTKLESIQKENMQVLYSYNADGIRTYKNVNGMETNYYVEGDSIIAEKTDNDTIWYIYDESSEICGFTYQEKTYYYDKNATKDVIRIVDENGTCICTYLYDAWGKVAKIEGNQTIGNINPIRYRSYYWDKETGFYYLKNRYYDCNTKRFLNADDVTRINVGDMDTNLYAYCGGDPVNLYDPDGRYTRKVAMFTVTDFKSEKSDIYKGISAKLKDKSTWKQKVSDSPDDFEGWWLDLGRRDLVIINSHADPNNLCIKGDGSILVTRGRINAYPQKYNIKLLVLLGCNAGHFSYPQCIARSFANRITGKVIASDGTVQASGSYSKLLKTNISFKSMKDDDFLDLLEDVNATSRKNYGWLVYVGAMKNFWWEARVYYLGDGTKKLTVNNICQFIDSASIYNIYQ